MSIFTPDPAVLTEVYGNAGLSQAVGDESKNDVTGDAM
jgi:hypothetical protein